MCYLVRSNPQVPPLSGTLPPLIHDFSMDLLCGHDRQRHRSGEGSEAKGDRAHHGSESFHLLAELGRVQHAASRWQRRLPFSYTEGDLKMIPQRSEEEPNFTSKECFPSILVY